jgi:hypothetical protein
MGMGGRLEAAVCGGCSLAIGGSGNKEYDGETATMINRATEMPQGRAN